MAVKELLIQEITEGTVLWEALKHPTPNVTEIRLVGSAHPTAYQGFRRSAKVDSSLIQGHSILRRSQIAFEVTLPGWVGSALNQ